MSTEGAQSPESKPISLNHNFCFFKDGAPPTKLPGFGGLLREPGASRSLRILCVCLVQ